MTFLNSVIFDKTGGLPLTGRLAHLSVPLGLVCSEKKLYGGGKYNFGVGEVISELDFANLTGSIQRKNKTRSSRNLQTNVTKKQRTN